jgi:hypothetical protein
MGLERYLRTNKEPEPVNVGEDTVSDSTPRGLERYANFGSPADTPKNNFIRLQRGVAAGTDNIQKSVWGFANMAAESLGLDRMQEYTMSQVEANEAEMQSIAIDAPAFDDIDSSDDFFKWMASSVGQAIPSLGLSFTSGGVGAILGRKALEHKLRDVLLKRTEKRLLERGLSAEEARGMATDYVMSAKGATILRRTTQGGAASSQFQNPGYARGATIGVFGSSSVPQIGESHLRLKEAGTFSPGTSIMAGVAGGMLELLPVTRLIDRAFPGVDRAISHSFIKDFAKGAGVQTTLEGSVEGAQEIIQLSALAFHDPSFDLLDPTNRAGVIEALAQGAVVGALTGGLGEVSGALVQGKRQASEKVDLPQWRMNLRERVRGTKKESEPELAENTFLEELRDRITSVAEDTMNPAMNVVRNTFQNGIDQVAEISPEMNNEMYRWVDRILQTHNEFVEAHGPVMDDTARYVSEQVAWIAEQAEAIQDPDERSAFI